MKNPHFRESVLQLLGVCALLALSMSAAVLAQPANGAPPTSAQVVTPTDALGRDSPRGTLLGFMGAVRGGNYEAAVHYLNTPLKGEDAVTLARQLYVVLDSRLPVRLTELSDRPEGSRANPLKPDQDVVGSISTAEGPLDLIVERVRLTEPPPVWLFSRRTLSAIPGIYDDINLISFDDYLPDVLGRPRILGIRLFEWVALLLLLPLSYRVMGFSRLPGWSRVLILAVAIRWGLAIVDLPLRERQLWSAVVALLLMVWGVWVLLRVNAYGERYIIRHFRDARLVEISSLVRLGRRLADVLVCVAGGLVALAYFGVDPTAALAGLGIGGIAVALAAQKTLENVIGGLSLIFDKAVRVGDFLKVGDVQGQVDSIGLRSTRIRTLDRTMLSVPNGQIANVTLETLSARDMCWFHHVVGLRYDTTSAQLRHVLANIRTRLAAHPAVDSASLRVRLFRFGPSSLDIEIFAYVTTGDWPGFLEIQEQLLVAVKELVEAEGTSMAFPTQTLQIDDPLARATLPLLPRGQDTAGAVGHTREQAASA